MSLTPRNEQVIGSIPIAGSIFFAPILSCRLENVISFREKRVRLECHPALDSSFFFPSAPVVERRFSPGISPPDRRPFPSVSPPRPRLFIFRPAESRGFAPAGKEKGEKNAAIS